MTDQNDTAQSNEKLANDQAQGLRALADFVEHNPQCADLLKHPLRIITHVFDDAGEIFAKFATAAARSGAVVDKDYSDKFAKVSAAFGPAVSFRLQTDREEVCTRVVTGTEMVTKTIKDPDALALVPDIEVTEEVEIVEWQCRPLLAGDRPVSADQ